MRGRKGTRETPEERRRKHTERQRKYYEANRDAIVERARNATAEKAKSRQPYEVKPRLVIEELPIEKGALPREHWPALADVARYRLESMAKYRRDTTMQSQRSTLTHAVLELPARPTPDEIFHWMNALVEPPPRGPGLMSTTVNTYKGHLSAAYEWCRKRGLYSANPTAGLPTLETERLPAYAPGAFGGPEAAVSIYGRLRTVFDPAERVALSLLRFCGVTREELYGLRDVDFDQRAWTLQIQRGKIPGLDKSLKRLKTTARTRMIRIAELMPPEELRELATYLRTPRMRAKAYGRREPGGVASYELTDYLFPWSTHQHARWMKKFYAVAPEVFGDGTAKGMRPLHTWRHAFAETAEDVLLGPDDLESMNTLRKLLGHAGLWTLQKYLAKRRGMRLKPGAARGLAEALRSGAIRAPGTPPLLVPIDTQAIYKQRDGRGSKPLNRK